MYLLEVLNPVASQRGMLAALKTSIRPETLNKKKVGLVWSGTHGGDVALKRLGEMFTENFDDLQTKFYTGGNYPAPRDVLERAAEECDVVVGATAD